MSGELIPVGGGEPRRLSGDFVTLGSKSDMKLRLKSSKVAEHHCDLSFEDGYWFVDAVSPDHITGVNRKRIRGKTRLLPNDTLHVQRFRFKIVYSAPEQDEDLALELLDQSPDKSSNASSKPNEAVEPKNILPPKRSREEKIQKAEADKPHPPTEIEKVDGDFGELVPCGGGDPIPLQSSVLLIGRGPDCDIRFKDRKVSSHHCRFTFEDGYWYVQDLRSSNGTRVDGVRVARKCLLPDVTVTIATTRYTIEYEPRGEVPVEEDMFGQSLMEKAGLQKAAEQKNAPAWMQEDDEFKRERYRLDE